MQNLQSDRWAGIFVLFFFEDNEFYSKFSCASTHKISLSSVEYMYVCMCSKSAFCVKSVFFLCILYTIFVLFYFVSFCFILHFYAFVKCVVSSTFSAHLPLLALGTTDVSGCVALAREHTRTAGRTHAAKAFCEVIKHLAYNTVEWVLIAQWQKGRCEAKLEGVTINSEGNHLLGRHKCWSDPGWTACDLDESSWE